MILVRHGERLDDPTVSPEEFSNSQIRNEIDITLSEKGK